MTLTAPTPRFAPEQLEEALATAKTIDHLASRSKALDSLAPRLEPVQLGEALVAKNYRRRGPPLISPRGANI